MSTAHHRNTHVLQLGGIRFYGDAEGLRRTTRELDRAAQALWSTQVRRFPTGVGRARVAIIRQLRVHFGGAVNESAVTRWLLEQNWKAFR